MKFAQVMLLGALTAGVNAIFLRHPSAEELGVSREELDAFRSEIEASGISREEACGLAIERFGDDAFFRGGPCGRRPQQSRLAQGGPGQSPEDFARRVCVKAGLTKEECDSTTDEELMAIADRLKAEFESLSEEDKQALRDEKRAAMDAMRNGLAQKRGGRGGRKGSKGDDSSEKPEPSAEDIARDICMKAELSKEECDELSEEDLMDLAEELKAEWDSLSEEERQAIHAAKMDADFAGHICRKAGLDKDECDDLDDYDLKDLADYLKDASDDLEGHSKQGSKDQAGPIKEGSADKQPQASKLAQKGGKGPKGPKKEMSPEEFGAHVCRKAGLSRDECDALTDDEIKAIADRLKAEFESLSEEDKQALRDEKEAAVDAWKNKLAQKEGPGPKGGLRGKACHFAGLSKDECSEISDDDLKHVVENIKAEFEGMSEDEVVEALHQARDELAAMDDEDLKGHKQEACRFLGLDRDECDDLDDGELKELVEEAKEQFAGMDEDDVRQVIREFDAATQ